MKLTRLAALAAATALVASPALGFHRWSTYHWQRTAAEISPPIGDNVDSKWDPYFQRVVDDWNKSIRIQSSLVAGSTNPKNCKAVAGTIQVCNSRYGNTGWLGIAQIWLSGGHISQGITKLNDTYFDTAQYNTPAWRRMVFCQEVGHDYGLGHTDETFDNANDGTCMDYTNAPAGGVVNGFNYGPSNEYPNAHDYQELEAIYNHQESAAATNFGERQVGKPASPPAGPNYDGADGGNSPSDWGKAIHFDGKGRPDVFAQDLPGGGKKITHVFWTLEAKRGDIH